MHPSVMARACASENHVWTAPPGGTGDPRPNPGQRFSRKTYFYGQRHLEFFICHVFGQVFGNVGITHRSPEPV